MTDSTPIDELARADVRALPLYAPDAANALVDLSDNTNLWGTPPAVMRSLGEGPPSAMARYPSLYGSPLRRAVLHYLGFADTDDLAVLTGCGSDDIIDSTMRAFGEPGERVAFSSPTFTMVPLFARLNGLTPVAVPLTAEFDIDAQRLVECRAKITYLCAPNNPTATAVSRAAVEYVISHAPGIVLLDEAYAEFAPEIFADLLATRPRLIVARTFSKAFGLAGLRIGVGVGSKRLIEFVARARGPYKVTSLAERAALAALDPAPDGLPWVLARAADAVHNRDRMIAELQRLGFAPLPSATNFIMIPTARARMLAGRLAEHGVIVRAFTGLPQEIPAFADNGSSALRISIGPWAMLQVVLDRLAELGP
ncbi:MAG: histidinol-phosphate transaminase [bacterium]